MHYRFCLAYVIGKQLDNELQDFVRHWNSHVIRSNCMTGSYSAIPNDLYEMPNYYGKLINFVLIK